MLPLQVRHLNSISSDVQGSLIRAHVESLIFHPTAGPQFEKSTPLRVRVASACNFGAHSRAKGAAEDA